MAQTDSTLSDWQPRLLSVLRIVAGLLFLQHGLVKILSFPGPFMRPVATGELIWFAGVIEIVGGILLVIGLFSRLAAFVCSGLMAFAYFLGHALAPNAKSALFPILNGGNLAVLYCFVFLYIAAAGPGPWSLDAQRGRA
jgi:putative oxidoreductase